MSEYPLLIPLTEAGKDALGGREAVAIDHLPFRIGPGDVLLGALLGDALHGKV